MAVGYEPRNMAGTSIIEEPAASVQAALAEYAALVPDRLARNWKVIIVGLEVFVRDNDQPTFREKLGEIVEVEIEE